MAKIDIKGDIIVNDYKNLYDWIGWDSTCPADVTEVLEAAAPDERIDVHINSGGGHVMAGQEIYSALRNDPRVVIHVDGMACSAASIIAMGGKSYISPVGMLMVHNVSGGASGDYHEMEKAADMLQSMNNALAAAYEAKAGISRADAIKMMDHETWLTANQCVDIGLIDAIEPPAQEENLAAAAYEGGIRMTPEMRAKVEAEIAADRALQAEKAEILSDLDAYGV